MWFESLSFLSDIAQEQVILSIFIPDHSIRKTLHVSTLLTAEKAVDLVKRNTPLEGSSSELFVPRTGIVLPPERPLYTFLLLDNEEVHLRAKGMAQVRIQGTAFLTY